MIFKDKKGKQYFKLETTLNYIQDIVVLISSTLPFKEGQIRFTTVPCKHLTVNNMKNIFAFLA